MGEQKFLELESIVIDKKTAASKVKIGKTVLSVHSEFSGKTPFKKALEHIADYKLKSKLMESTTAKHMELQHEE